MQILLDTANLDTIRRYNEYYNLAGVTTNPTILAREKAPFWDLITGIREIIGETKMLHVQLTAREPEELIREAETVTSRLGRDVYLKVAVTEEGLRGIRYLKREGFRVTGTIVYSFQQAAMAASAGADYVAPYFNRMSNNGLDPAAEIRGMKSLFAMNGLPTKVLGASFKNTQQIEKTLLAGADAVTAPPELYTAMAENALVREAAAQFASDWKSVYGDKRIWEL